MSSYRRSNRKDKSTGMLFLSVLLHGTAVVGLIVVAANKVMAIPEGTTDTIEFTTTEEVSKGQQIVTTKPAPEIAPKPLPEEKPIPVAKAPKKEEVKKSEAVAKPKKEKAVAATELPKKEKIAEPVAEDIPPVSVVPEELAEESPVVVTPIEETAANEIDAEQIKKIEEDAAAFAAAQELEAQQKDLVSDASDANTENTESGSEEIQDPAPAQTAPVAASSESQTQSQAQEASSAESDLAFGVASGTRSHLDLKQRPGNRPPQYPLTARRKGYEGRVVLKYYVTADGRVKDIKMLQSSGHPSLDSEALTAIARYRYYKGQEGWAEHPVDFALKGQAYKMPSKARGTQASK